MDRAGAAHVTLVLLSPASVGVNCCVPLVFIDVELGVTVIDTASAVRIGELAAAVTPPQAQFTTATAKLRNRRNNEVADERRIPTPLLLRIRKHRGVECF